MVQFPRTGESKALLVGAIVISLVYMMETHHVRRLFRSIRRHAHTSPARPNPPDKRPTKCRLESTVLVNAAAKRASRCRNQLYAHKKGPAVMVIARTFTLHKSEAPPSVKLLEELGAEVGGDLRLFRSEQPHFFHKHTCREHRGYELIDSTFALKQTCFY